MTIIMCQLRLKFTMDWRDVIQDFVVNLENIQYMIIHLQAPFSGHQALKG